MNATGTAQGAAPLLEVRDLCVSYPAAGRAGLWSRARVTALAEVSFQLRAGETLALVGESGSGKTTAALALLALLPSDSGQILWSARDGRRLDLARLGERELREQRPDLGVVFQDPLASLDPRRSVAHSVGEALAWHGRARGQALRQRVEDLLGEVGLTAETAERRPHELSGGQRQRVALARALALEPRLLVCDEIVSALDASVQAQVLELLARLQRARGLALVFVSHDLGVVRHVADRVAVLYAGRIVETGRCADVFEWPAHPYTRALVAAVPGLERRPWPTAQSAPRPVDARVGCAYRGRCPLAEARCAQERPVLRATAERTVACHAPVEGSGSASA